MMARGFELRGPRRGRLPAVVWWITGLHLCLLLAFSVLMPTYRAPDEPQHIDLVHLFSEELEYPAWDEGQTSEAMRLSLRIVHFHTKSAHLTAGEAPPAGERPTLEELGDIDDRSGINQQTQHPPLYYVAAGTAGRVIEAITGDLSFDREAWLYRSMSVALLAPLPVLIWKLSRHLRLAAPVGVAAMLVPLAIPEYLHIGSAVNNDNLSVLLFAVLALFVLRLADGDLRPRTAAAAGVISGLALLTKGFGLMALPWVGLALLVALRRGGTAARRPVLRAGALYAAGAFVVGGWWWLRNLVVYGALSPTRMDELLATRGDEPVDVWFFVEQWAVRTSDRFWGVFGWHDVPLPTTAITLATVVFLGALVVACVRRDRVGHTPIATRLLLLTPFVLLLASLTASGYLGHVETGQLPGLQGRYMFSAMAPIAVLVALGLANLTQRRTWVLAPLLLAAAAAMQAAAFSTILGFYWGAPGSAIGDRLHAVVAWSPLPGVVLGVGTALGVLCLAGTVVAVLQPRWDGRGGQRVDGLRRSHDVEIDDETAMTPYAR